MKKIFCLILVTIILTVFLTSCMNVSVGPGTFKFTKIHVCVGDHQKCIEISKWYDSEIGIEVYSEQYGAMFFSEGTYILIEDKCPLCDR